MKLNTKTLLILAAVLIVLAAVVSLLFKPEAFAPTQVTQETLTTDLTDVENADIDSIDSELNRLDQDSSGF